MIVSLLVEDEGWAAIPDIEARVTRACAAAWRRARGREPEGELSVLLTGDVEAAELNARWRGKPGPTNVLSFPPSTAPLPAGAEPPLGDLALAYGIVAGEARAQGRSLEAHMVHLIVHGCLHLLGHDHEREEEAAAMESLEGEILAQIGIADPYGCEHERR